MSGRNKLLRHGSGRCANVGLTEMDIAVIELAELDLEKAGQELVG